MKKVAFLDQWTCKGKPVTLPHDAMLDQGREATAPSESAQACFLGGRYIYEKKFIKPKYDHLVLYFEGVYKNAKVYVNGKEAGGKPYGYIPFYVTLDEYIINGENTITVECENENQPDSRWYTGAGIYRPVWLYEGPKDSIEPESVRVTTVSTSPAVIAVDSPVSVKAEVEGVSGEGTHFELTIANAKLWSADEPNLYTLKVSNGSDFCEVPFGIRKLSWSTEGFFVNGVNTLLKGGCVHHTNGILGAACHDESEYRKVRLMKEAGFNAIRSSHNPASDALLRACDELGMYVIDEAWDMWFNHKSKYDYATIWREHYLDDLAAMIKRDYNHPSVVMYSIGNEVSEPAKPEGIEATKEMAEFLHAQDISRAVTGGFNLMIISLSAKGKGIYDEKEGSQKDNDADKMSGMSSTMFNFITSLVGPGMNKAANGKDADVATAPSLSHLDICGYNYASGRYEMEGKCHPERILFGSETFPYEIAKNWEMVKKLPYLIGDFMWTAIDYLGEAGIGAWAYSKDGKTFNKPYPWLLGDTGAMDILGDPNGELFQAMAAWETTKNPLIAVKPINHDTQPAHGVWRGTNSIPSWAWKDCEGKKAEVEVYANADKVELFLNGKSLGSKRVKLCQTLFKVKYVKGKLEAVSYDASGAEIGRSALVSAEGPLKVCVDAKKNGYKPGEIVYIPVAICDANGTVEANADRVLSVTAKKGELLAFGSANPRTESHYLSGTFETYYGHALAVVRADSEGNAQISIKEKIIQEGI